MRDGNVLSIKRCMPRMSWHPRNLYNLWRRSLGDKAAGVDFRQTRQTLFQSRWASKALVRAYHGDFIKEHTFKRWYLPPTLPDVRPRRRIGRGDDRLELTALAGRGRDAARELKRVEDDARHALAPVGSLMFGEVERRIDVLIFRACLAHSVYEARRMVIHGDVKLNGIKHQDANTRLAPGDMVSVDPNAIRFLQSNPEWPSSVDPFPEAGAEADSPHPTMKPISFVNAPAEPEAAKPKSADEANLTPFNLPPYASPFLFVPAYIEVSFPTCSAVLVRHPTARADYSEIPTPYEADGEVVRFAWEWYASRRPRVRTARQRAQSPINRQSSSEPVLAKN